MYKNKEGYPDPTAGRAVRKADKPPEDYKKAIHMMICAAECFGFSVECRIVLRDNKTGHVWP